MADYNDFEWEIKKTEEKRIEIKEIQDSNILCDTINNLILNQDYNSFKSFLTEKAFRGKNMPIINKSIALLLRSESFNYNQYWTLVNLLISHNATLFLATIYKNTVTSTSLPPCEPLVLKEIINKALQATDKLRYAIGIIGFVYKQLSFEQKIQILTSCLKTNSSETLKFAFETLKLPPPFVISFLRNKIDNTVVLYTLYDYYRTAYQNNEIIENTTVEVFSIPYINILILDLKRNGNKMSKDVADLIEYELKLDEFCKNIKLYNLVSKQGYKGFNIYYSKIKIEAHIKENVENLELYNKKYSFRVIGKTTKYYLLFNNSTHQHALLPIELSDAIEKPLISAYIYKIDKKRNVLYVNQLPVPKGYKEPSLLDIGSIVDVSFSLRNERLIPRLRNHTNLLRIKVQNIIMVKDFKQKYKAIVKKRLNDFLFLVEILDSGF